MSYRCPHDTRVRLGSTNYASRAAQDFHDMMTAGTTVRGMRILPAGSPDAACDSAAPVSVKNMPAYAHSFTRGQTGARIATAPSSSHVPRIVAKYVG